MEHIKIYENVLPEILCDKLINFFEKSNHKQQGVTMNGINLDIKKTYDLHLGQEDTKESLELDTILNEINEEYITKYLNEILYKWCPNYKKEFYDKGFQIQKYSKNDGFYIYHIDENINNQEYRILTYIYYLNTVYDGGETEFFGNKIKAEKGKLVIFPCSWNYTHRGIMPISNDKYIITGWLYSKTYNK